MARKITPPPKGSYRDKIDEANGDAGADDGEDFGVLPDGAVITKHCNQLVSLQGKLAELRGKMGAAVKTAEDDHNIHRGAMKLAVKLKGMDPTKLAEWLRHFDHYRAELHLDGQLSLDLASDKAAPASRKEEPAPAPIM